MAGDCRFPKITCSLPSSLAEVLPWLPGMPCCSYQEMATVVAVFWAKSQPLPSCSPQGGLHRQRIAASFHGSMQKWYSAPFSFRTCRHLFTASWTRKYASGRSAVCVCPSRCRTNRALTIWVQSAMWNCILLILWVRRIVRCLHFNVVRRPSMSRCRKDERSHL